MRKFTFYIFNYSARCINNYYVLFSVAPNIDFGKEYFEGLTVKAGDKIKLKVNVTGRPTPHVKWFKDGEEIDRRMMIDITTTNGLSMLFIRDADRNHCGIYSVEAKNASGSKKEDIHVQVLGMYVCQ